MKKQDQTILLADSQIDEIAALKQAIESGIPGTKVVTADRGDRALDLADSRPLRAVLADMRLSDMSGLKLLMKLKASHPEVVAIMLSDAGGDRAESLCREAGIDGFLEKPLSIPRLHAMLGGIGEGEGAVFRGTLRDLSVPDVLQLVVDREPPMLMRIDSELGQGAIEIVGGEVVHARVNGKIGEQAFHELVTWQAGHFEVVDVLWPEERTIAMPLQQILVRAAAYAETKRTEEAREESRRMQEARPATSFFDSTTQSATAGSIWDYTSHYTRPGAPASAASRSTRAAAMAAMPAFAAYYRERGGGQPLRFKARESRPPAPPEPAPVETAPPAPPSPGPMRRPVRLPSARRILVASSLAICAIMAVAHFSGLFTVQYARDFAPAFMDMVHDIVPGAERQERARQTRRTANAEPSAASVAISNNRLAPAAPSRHAGQATQGIRRQNVAAETTEAPWHRLTVGVRDDDQLLSGVNHVGVRADLFDQLQLGTNPWVDLRCTQGRRMGGFAVRIDHSPEPVIMTRSMARGFGYGLEDVYEVNLRPVEWANRPGQSVAFETQRDLPGRFCTYWYSVGLSLSAMQEAGLTPGAHAVVRGPQGLQTVRVQLVDRGRDNEIWLSKPVRDAVGDVEGSGAIVLFPKS